MKRLLLSSAVLLVGASMLTSPMRAQTDAPPPPPQSDTQGPPQGGPGMHGPGDRLQHMQHALNLTSDQTAQVKSLLDSERTRGEAIRANSALAPADRRSQMMANRDDTNTKIRALLTADQATKFDAMEARMREHRHGPPPPPPGSPEGANPGPGAV